jgi:hypothetical protein
MSALMWKSAVVLLLVACSRPAVPASEHLRSTFLTHDAIVHAMQRADAGDRASAEALGIDLKAYNWTWDLSAQRGLRQHLVTISKMWDSELFLFGPSGKLLSRLSSPGEMHSIQLFDFDGDGNAEIICTQTTDRGTGVLRDEFIIYSTFAGRLHEIWRAPSFWYSSGAYRRFGERNSGRRKSAAGVREPYL